MAHTSHRHEEKIAAEKARQGEIVLKKRPQVLIFIAGFAGIAVVAIVLLLASI